MCAAQQGVGADRRPTGAAQGARGWPAAQRQIVSAHERRMVKRQQAWTSRSSAHFATRGPSRLVAPSATWHGFGESTAVDAGAKRKAFTTVRLADGFVCEAEVHWYEATGIGRRELRIKRLLR
jgi:hypothetical protein